MRQCPARWGGVVSSLGRAVGLFNSVLFQSADRASRVTAPFAYCCGVEKGPRCLVWFICMQAFSCLLQFDRHPGQQVILRSVDTKGGWVLSGLINVYYAAVLVPVYFRGCLGVWKPTQLSQRQGPSRGWRHGGNIDGGVGRFSTNRWRNACEVGADLE